MYSAKSKWFSFILYSIIVILLLTGCGDEADESEAPSPEASAELVATQPAPPSEPTATPAPTVVAVPTVAAAPQPATTVYQAAQLLDLRNLPLPAGVEANGQARVGDLTYQAPLKVAEVADHYRVLLTGQGWQELSEPAYSDDTSALLYFQQDGFTISLSVGKIDDSNTMVTLLNHGNIDLATLPQTSDAEAGFAGPNTLIYFSPTGVEAAAEFIGQELVAQGWSSYTRPGTTVIDSPDTKSLSFIQNGLELTAYIAIAPAQAGKTSVQYSITLLPLDLPIAAGVDQVEFEAGEPYLSYPAATDVATLLDFYRQTMPDLGWVEIAEAANISAEQADLAFAHQAEQVALVLNLSQSGSTTTVTLQSDQAQAETLLVESDGTAQGSDGADLTAFPLPDDAQDVTYEASEITFSNASALEDVVEFYRERLAAEGWQEQSDFSEVDESFAFVEFDREDEIIYLTVINFGDTNEAIIDLSEAYSWVGSPADEDLADLPSDAPTYTIADWPVPAEATEVDLSGEELTFKVAMSLVDVAEFYWPTFEMMELGTSCLEDVADYTSLSCSSSNGYVSLNFFAFEGLDDQTEVEISFTNTALDSDEDESGSSDSGELTAIDEEGLPLPSDYTGYAAESGGFRRGLTFTSPSDIPTLQAFYESELAALGWEIEETSEAEGVMTMTIGGAEGPAVLTLKPAGSETEGALFIKDTAAAKEAGIIPPAGQGRVYLINLSDQELSVLINDQTLKVPAGAGSESPDTAVKLDLRPNRYNVTTTSTSGAVVDEVTVGPDEVWSLLLDAQGALPLQMY